MKNVKIGVHPINWYNEDKTDSLPGNQYPFYDIVDRAAEAGYAGLRTAVSFRERPRSSSLNLKGTVRN